MMNFMGAASSLEGFSHAPVISTLWDGGPALWSSFVTRHEDTHLLYDWHWAQAVQDSLGHRIYRFAAHHEEQLRGVISLTHIHSQLFGSRLVAGGFGVYGTLLADNQMAMQALLHKAQTLALELGVDYLEVRQDIGEEDGWQKDSHSYAHFVCDLQGNDQDWQQIGRKKRADIRKALNNEKLYWVDAISIEEFYALHAVSQRNHGTPVQNIDFFHHLKQQFGQNCLVTGIRYDGRLVAALMSFIHKDCIFPYYSGALPQAVRELHAYDALYWHCMQQALRYGCSRFDFGRSKVGTGAYHYKKHWGMKAIPLTYSYYPLQGKPPDLNPLSPRWRWKVAAWKRLPLWMANYIGPKLAKGLG